MKSKLDLQKLSHSSCEITAYSSILIYLHISFRLYSPLGSIHIKLLMILKVYIVS